MHNALKNEIAQSEVNYYTTNELRVAKIHTKPAVDPNRVGLWTMRRRFARVLGEAAKHYPDNMVRNVISWRSYDLQESENMIRLAGALRRWVELEQERPMLSGYIEPGQGLLGPNDDAGHGGMNSPHDWTWQLVRLLEKFSFNADHLWSVFHKVLRWTGADVFEVLDALKRNSRPRRAAMLIRVERKLRLQGEFRSWSEARKFLIWCHETRWAGPNHLARMNRRYNMLWKWLIKYRVENRLGMEVAE